jgi:hypothetical protein
VVCDTSVPTLKSLKSFTYLSKHIIFTGIVSDKLIEIAMCNLVIVVF